MSIKTAKARQWQNAAHVAINGPLKFLAYYQQREGARHVQGVAMIAAKLASFIC